MDTKANPAVMNQPSFKPQTDDEISVYNLYLALLESWNKQNAENYGDLFLDDGSVIGFDGSQMNGKKEISEALKAIFAHHRTNLYLGKVRELRFLHPDVALLRAVAGMYKPDNPVIVPAVNTIQTMVAIRDREMFCIALFQNTPAQFHGRPELTKALTRELQSELGYVG